MDDCSRYAEENDHFLALYLAWVFQDYPINIGKSPRRCIELAIKRQNKGNDRECKAIGEIEVFSVDL